MILRFPIFCLMVLPELGTAPALSVCESIFERNESMKNVTKIFAVAVMSIGFVACGPANGQFNQFSPYGAGMNGFNQFGQNGVMMGGSNCINQAQQGMAFGFTGTNIQMNSAGGFYAGALPQTHARSGQYGTVSLSQAGGINNAGGGIMLNKQSQFGVIQMSLNPQTRTISGMIQLNQAGLYSTGIMNYMYSNMNGMNGMNQYQYQQYPNQYQQFPNQNMNQFNTGSVCVTSIAMDVLFDSGYSGYYQPNGTIRNALVYLYLSNGQAIPMPVQF